jgi:hypothetical protein
MKSELELELELELFIFMFFLKNYEYFEINNLHG